jgi:putative flippase GtrA
VQSVSEQSGGPGDSPSRRLGAWAREPLRYLFVAAFSFLWVLGSSAGLHELVGLGQRLAVALALISALGINFTLLRLFVFPGQSASVGSQLAATAAVSASFRALEYGGFLLLSGAAGLHYLAATALALLTSSVAKFLIYRNIVFRRRGASDEPGPLAPAQSSTGSPPARSRSAGSRSAVRKPPGS